ncbi:hypothetical protein AG1IA_07210 [Rhizoctonia solani AG-1 IA]|uniref:Uncharacterized protein n=1 Tax=Thanatephorus cucumeris (strain AG1-IA) TaxID=983506 RepID=L8WR22_THACA|nr:hypothetical protein AG1IA_07210 [Rhizoctonia solani AG-1 IA]
MMSLQYAKLYGFPLSINDPRSSTFFRYGIFKFQGRWYVQTSSIP